MTFLIAACSPIRIEGATPEGERFFAVYYSGDFYTPDAVVIGEKAFLGKAAFVSDRPTTDIVFTALSGQTLQAACEKQGQNQLGKTLCLEYRVLVSDFEEVPVGTTGGRSGPY